MNENLRVFLADPSPVVLLGLKQVISAANMVVCGEACTGRELIEMLEDSGAQLLVIDLVFPDTSGWDLIQAIQKKLIPIEFLVFSNDCSLSSIQTALNMGVKGYLLKREPLENIILAIQSVSQSCCWFSLPIYNTILSHKAYPAQVLEFDHRETKAIHLICQGHRDSVVAANLGISERTVRLVLRKIYDKMKVETRIEAIAWAIQHNVFPSNRIQE